MSRTASSAHRMLPFTEPTAATKETAQSAPAQVLETPSTQAIDAPPPFGRPPVEARFEPRSGLDEGQVQAALDAHAGRPVAPLVSKILSARGFSSKTDLLNFIDPIEATLPRANAILGLEQSLEILNRSIVDRSPVAIIADYDVDGLTGAAQLHELLRRLHVPVAVYIPDRISEGYGINSRIVKEIIKNGAQAVVAIDLGTSGHSHLSALRNAGVRTVVWDHHEPQNGWPECDAIVNPHRPGCALGEMAPSASGITWLALRELIQRGEHQALLSPDNILPLAAMATLCDMVPLTSANRFLVKKLVNSTLADSHAGISALSAALSEHHASREKLSSEDIAYYLGPAINSAGRLGRTENAWQVLTAFEAADREKISESARSLVALNYERTLQQKSALAKCFQALAAQDSLGPAIVLSVSDISPGVIGLCAQALSEHYARPAIVLTAAAEGLRGSARGGPGNINLQSALAQSSDYLVSFGGHRAAAGIVVRPEQLQQFRHAFEAAAAPHLLAHRTVIPDSVTTLAELTPETVSSLQRIFEPTGSSMRAPSVMLKGVVITKIEAFAKGVSAVHLEQSGARGRAISFDADTIAGCRRGQAVDLVVEPRLDRYRSNERVALHIKAVTRTYRRTETLSMLPSPHRSLFDHLEDHAPSHPTITDKPTVIIEKRLPKSRPQQTGLDFGSSDLQEPNVYRVSSSGKIQRVDRSFPSALPATISELASLHGLTHLNLTGIRSEPEQLKFLQYALTYNESLVCDAAPGDGKTSMALVLASKYLQRGEKVLYIVPRLELIEQAEKEAARFLTLPANWVRGLSGDDSPEARRDALGNPDHKLFFQTAESALNDITHGALRLNEFSFFILDEGQSVSGNRASALVIDQVVAADIRRLILTGTLATSKTALAARISRLGDPFVYHVESAARERNDILHLVHRAPLEPMLNMIQKFAVQSAIEIERGTEKHAELERVREWARAISDTNAPRSRISADSIREHMLLVRELADQDGSIGTRRALGNVISHGWQLAHLHQLAERGERYGTAMMLLKAIDVGFPALVSPIIQRPLYINRLYGTNAEFRHELLAFSHSKTAQALLSGAVSFTENGVTGKQFKKSMIDRLRGELPQLTDIDHPKFEALLHIARDPQVGKILVYTGLVEHARFVADALQRLDIAAGSFTGKGSGSSSVRQDTLDKFKRGEIDTLIATSVADVGLDLSGLTHIVHWDPDGQNSSVHKQRNGRVSRLNSEEVGTTIKLALIGSDDQSRYETLKTSAEAIGKWFSVK